MAERAALAAAALVLAFALREATLNAQPDLFIYRQGALIGLRGESPYEPSKIRAAVTEQFPEQVELQNNCGFFLPPAAVLLYTPFALVPWDLAKVLWAVVCGVAAYGVTLLVRERPAGMNPAARLVLPILLVLNFLTLAIIQVGQTTLLTVGCISFGLVCFEKNRPRAGTLLWSVAFVKPHVAIALIPLAWFLGGWKRAAGLLLIVGLENVVGAMIAGGSPLFLREYLDFLAAGHKAVAYNLASENFEITSWNRLLFVVTGHAIEQTAITTLAGWLIWFGLVVGRCAITNTAPSRNWALAAAAAGSAFVPQVLGYEVLVLALAVPWVCDTYRSGLKLLGGLAGLLLAAQLVPIGMFQRLDITFHRPHCVFGFVLVVLAGPIKPLHVPARVEPPPADR